MKVSIVTVAYNSSATLEDTIKSVLAFSAFTDLLPLANCTS